MDLPSLTVVQLRQIARQLDIKRIYRLRKNELVDVIRDALVDELAAGRQDLLRRLSWREIERACQTVPQACAGDDPWRRLLTEQYQVPEPYLRTLGDYNRASGMRYNSWFGIYSVHRHASQLDIQTIAQDFSDAIIILIHSGQNLLRALTILANEGRIDVLDHVLVLVNFDNPDRLARIVSALGLELAAQSRGGTEALRYLDDRWQLWEIEEPNVRPMRDELMAKALRAANLRTVDFLVERYYNYYILGQNLLLDIIDYAGPNLTRMLEYVLTNYEFHPGQRETAREYAQNVMFPDDRDLVVALLS